MLKKTNSNLIGISGKLNGGKDFSAKLIQYHIANERLKEHDGGVSKEWRMEDFMQLNPERRFKESLFKTRSFAYKLKKMIAVLLDVSIHELEDREFKNFPLSNFGGKTPREMMQSIGTEWGRKLVYENIWASALINSWKPDAVQLHLLQPTGDEMKPNWLVTDVRFPNEVKAIQDAGGIVIRVDRPTELRYPDLWEDFQASEYDVWDDYLKSINRLGEVYHPSECALDEFSGFDHRISWREDETDLIVDLKLILQDEGIISD